MGPAPRMAIFTFFADTRCSLLVTGRSGPESRSRLSRVDGSNGGPLSRRVDLDGIDPAHDAKWLRALHDVPPALLHFPHERLGKPGFQDQLSFPVSIKPRLNHRLGSRHPKVDHVENDLDQTSGDARCARGAQHGEGPAVPQKNGLADG